MELGAETADGIKVEGGHFGDVCGFLAQIEGSGGAGKKRKNVHVDGKVNCKRFPSNAPERCVLSGNNDGWREREGEGNKGGNNSNSNSKGRQ